MEITDFETNQIPCRGKCGKSTFDGDHAANGEYWLRHDAYGIPTGHWCKECYNNDERYTYRRDRYQTEEWVDWE